MHTQAWAAEDDRIMKELKDQAKVHLFILQAFDLKFFNGIKMQFVSSIVNEMLMRRFYDSQGLTIYIHFAKSVEEKQKPASKVPPQQAVQTAPWQIRETDSLGSCLDERRSIYSELS